MGKRLLAGLVATLTLFALASPAQAIRYGSADDGEHPYVGFMIAYTEDATGVLKPAWRCSGTLLDSTTFLTAGHCTYGADYAAVWFEEDVDYFTGAIIRDPYNADGYGEVYVHPEYNDNAFYTDDVGIVKFEQPVTNVSTYGVLPELGYWDGQFPPANTKTTYDVVGYGLQRNAPDPAFDNVGVEIWMRLKAEVRLINNDRMFGGRGLGDWVGLSNNANTGGICNGDSGGPTFIHGTNIVVAVTSFGMNTQCAGVGGAYRIDTVDDLAFIRSYLG